MIASESPNDLTVHQGHAPPARWLIVLIAITACMTFALLTSVNLTAQGLFYDEVHQAPAAFAYQGKQVVMFNPLQIYGLPLLNMSYSGALKSGIYGLYLRLFDAHFTIQSWRLLGIGFVGSGIGLFCLAGGRFLPIGALVIFLCLFLTDTTLLLTTRHDWGPTALALLLRLLFIAAWMRCMSSGTARGIWFVMLGALAGLAMFEKLSAVVLLGPLACLCVASSRRHTLRNGLQSGFGLMLGSIPLIVTNIWSLIGGRGLISLAEVAQEPVTNPVPLVQQLAFFGFKYLTIGQGRFVRSLVLGDTSGRTMSVIEALLLGATFLVAVVLVLRRGADTTWLLPALRMFGCYGAVAIGLLFLPRTTSIHHWLIGTPFQYTAIALTFAALSQPEPVDQGTRTWLRKGFLVSVCLLILLRLPAVVAVEASLVAGKSSRTYSPAFTTIASFAAKNRDRALFIAADWGFATQIYAMSNGHDDIVYEPFWEFGGTPSLMHEPFWKDRFARDLSTITARSNKQILYLLNHRPANPMFPENTAAITAEIEQSPVWREVPVEQELAGLSRIEVRKFQLTGSASGPPQ